MSEVTETEQTPIVVELTPKEALREVLRTSLYNQGLARGLHEAVKALDRNQAHLAILSKTCNENAYTKLITALCKTNGIPLLVVDNGTIIGEMVGLARLKADGTPAKTINCTCAVVREWGQETHAREVILKHIEAGNTQI